MVLNSLQWEVINAFGHVIIMGHLEHVAEWPTFYLIPESNSFGTTRKARAIRTIFSRLTFLSPRSMPPTYVQWRSASSASLS